MDYKAIAPIIQEAIQKALSEKRYRFGRPPYGGLSNKIASGKLYNSIQVITKKKSDDETTLQVLMENYGQWVQSGRLPNKKNVPIQAIEQWIRNRKLRGRDKKGKFIKTKNFAFAIQTNIRKFGIRPSNFLDVAVQIILNNPNILGIIEDETLKEIMDNLEGI